MTIKTEHCWVIHDGAAGNRRQAVALAEALGWSFDEKTLHAKGLAKLFAPRILPFSAHPFGNDFAVEMQNAPAYVIGCGRQAALATRLMKKTGSFAIQILDPGIATHHWDVVIAPNHDRMQGENVIACNGSLHDVNEISLELWRSKEPAFENLDAPRTAVFIGGPSRMAVFNEGLIEVLFSQLEYDLAKRGGSLIICGSRRTPSLAAKKIRQRFSDSHFPVWFDDGDGENLYHAALVHADRIVLTPDSVNMISEACATQLPVYIAQPERATGRLRIFLDELMKTGRVRPLNRESVSFPVTALNTMPDVIEKLKLFLNP
ncbi:MAG TPA: mitochondrial fission ELM1 family protein [Arenimonas sp.]|nr:mitochondrial fission ELM1 family protein [Arenimonas sp.]